MSAALRPEPRPVPIARLATAVGGQFDPDDGRSATGITHDSRQVLAGDVYAALPGHRTHGAGFAAHAVERGAVAIATDPDGRAACTGLGVPLLVVESPRRVLGTLASVVYGDPASRLRMLAVTGTNGKTTVAAMVADGLAAAGLHAGVIGTMGVRIGDEVVPGARTTPEASDLHAILATMVERGVDSVVMEVSSIAIDEHRVDGVRFDVSGFTNLSQDHLDYHGTMDAYFAAKQRLFEPERSVSAVIGIDDDWGRRLADECRIPHTTWSLVDAHADWHAQRTADGLAVFGPGDAHALIKLRLPGAFNAANAVCAFGILRSAGVEADAAAAGIGRAEVAGRMQVVRSIEAPAITGIVDYAHSPDAIERVLLAVRAEYPHRVIVVLGAGGDRDRTKRRLMGRLAADNADVLVVTDDNPRSEDPRTIRAALIEGADDVAPGGRAEVREEGDRAAAITVAVEIAEPGDVVVVLGKGHEQGQESAGVVTPFDDATVLSAALERHSSGPHSSATS